MMSIKLLFVTAMLILLSACAKESKPQTASQKHNDISSELKVIMHELNMVIYDRYDSELDKDNTRRREAMQLGKGVKDISIQIQKIQINKDLKKQDPVLFKKYAKELYNKGDIIYNQARDYQLDKLDSSYKNIQKTCKACHKEFRKKKK